MWLFVHFTRENIFAKKIHIGQICFLDGTSELIADRTVSWYIEYLAVPVRNKSGALNTNKRCWNNDDMIFDTKYVKMIDIDIINSMIINN